MPDYDPHEDERLLEVDVYRGRLKAFCAMAGIADLGGRDVLAVGTALGGEAIAAAQLGAKNVVGLEIDQSLVDRSREIARRLDVQSVSFRLFDGTTFPVGPAADIVLSGHVIEHTPNPRRHLASCMAALTPGGLLFLEFPTRFHRRELHTGRIGFEWLPGPLRNVANTAAGLGAAARGDTDARHRRAVINRTLRQVSTAQVRWWLGSGGAITAEAAPSPGIVRLVIRKQ